MCSHRIWTAKTESEMTNHCGCNTDTGCGWTAIEVAHEAVTAPSSPTSSPSILLERHDYGHQSFPLHESSFFSLLAL